MIYRTGKTKAVWISEGNVHSTAVTVDVPNLHNTTIKWMQKRKKKDNRGRSILNNATQESHCTKFLSWNLQAVGKDNRGRSILNNITNKICAT